MKEAIKKDIKSDILAGAGVGALILSGTIATAPALAAIGGISISSATSIYKTANTVNMIKKIINNSKDVKNNKQSNNKTTNKNNLRIKNNKQSTNKNNSRINKIYNKYNADDIEGVLRNMSKKDYNKIPKNILNKEAPDIQDYIVKNYNKFK